MGKHYYLLFSNFFLSSEVIETYLFSCVFQQTLKIDHVERSDRGMYQCVVSNADETAQGTAQLKLGGKKFQDSHVAMLKLNHNEVLTLPVLQSFTGQ